MYTVTKLSQIIAPTQHILVRHGKSTLYQGTMRNIIHTCINRHVVSIRPTVQKNGRRLLILYVGELINHPITQTRVCTACTNTMYSDTSGKFHCAVCGSIVYT